MTARVILHRCENRKRGKRLESGFPLVVNGNKGLPCIAHYNFSAALPKLWALPRGWALPRPTYGSALRTRSDGCQPPTPLTKE